jgi:Gram-negative bacterial TonB protein C-terminal
MLKQVPEFPADIVRKYRHQMIVASAILQADGKLEQVAIRQSPEQQLAEPPIEALQHWLFEPAKIDGKPVALKILLGIRLAASH